MQVWTFVFTFPAKSCQQSAVCKLVWTLPNSALLWRFLSLQTQVTAPLGASHLTNLNLVVWSADTFLEFDHFDWHDRVWKDTKSAVPFITMNVDYLPSVFHGPRSPAIIWAKISSNNFKWCVLHYFCKFGPACSEPRLLLQVSWRQVCFERNFRLWWTKNPSLLRTRQC